MEYSVKMVNEPRACQSFDTFARNIAPLYFKGSAHSLQLVYIFSKQMNESELKCYFWKYESSIGKIESLRSYYAIASPLKNDRNILLSY